MIRITNGKIVLPDSIIEGCDLIIEDQYIEDIVKTKESKKYAENCEVVDAKGGYIAPGFIDIHADYIEYIASPRPTSLMDFNLAIREAERELLTHGVTTMYHSLSLYKDNGAKQKPIRKQENVRRLVDVISKTHNQNHLIRHRFHARFEIDNIDSVDVLKDYIMKTKLICFHLWIIHRDRVNTEI